MTTLSEDQKTVLLRKELILLREIRRRQCTESFYQFVLDAHKVLYPGDPLDENWHMKYICDELQKESFRIFQGRKKDRDIIINVPPRSLKSIICTICWPAWMWIHKPSIKFIGSSYSGDLSLKHNMLTKDIVTSSWYQENWGNSVKLSNSRNTQEYYETQARGYRTCTSTGGTVTGVGADVVVIDDPINPMRAESETERATANEFFDRTLSTRLNKPGFGLFVVIMQRLHTDDLTGHLMQKEPHRYHHICIPAEQTKDVSPPELNVFYKDELFFKERFNREWLDDIKVKLGSYGYAGQMLQTPFLEGSGMIQAKWFGRFIMSELPPETIWNFCIDTAYTKKTKNDPSAILCWAVHENYLYIRGFNRVYFEFPKLIKHIISYSKENGYSYGSRIYIEPKASGISTIQQVKYETMLNVIQDEAPTTDKVSRAADMSPAIEAGKVKLLNGASWIDDFLYELESFPQGKHDESIDLLSMAIRKFQKKNRRTRYTFGFKNYGRN